MTLPYLPRLFCLALASFFLVHLAAALLVAVCSPFAIRTARRYSPGRAARFLLIVRLLPSALAWSAALGLCVPSYLWFEPELFDEPVGVVCLIAAMLGLILCGIAITRAIRAAVRSLLFARCCRRSSHEMPLPDRYPPTFIVEDSAPFLALTGIVRPRVVISESIVDALSEEELSVVLRHERAHRASRDNLKRLCMFLAPGIVPLRELERSWKSFTEYAADEQAVSGDFRRSLALASALVRVARFGSNRPAAPLAISFLGEDSDLCSRVDRLLTDPPSLVPSHRASRYRAASVVLAAAILVPAMLQPATFRFVQSVLERLIR